MVANKKYVPFGSNVPRFGKFTAHPKLDQSGLHVVRPAGCDPCLYNPKPIEEYCTGIHTQATKDIWLYKTELEDWSKNLGYRNQKILARKRWERASLGPAWHDTPEPSKYLPACMNVGLGRTSRNIKSRNVLPGPGTYYKAVPFKAPYGPHSTRPTFEMGDMCRFKDTTPKWSLAPGRYKVVDKESIEEKPKKICSLKGPYQLFTVKRDYRSIKNHFGNTGRIFCKSWPYYLPGKSLEKYKKTHFGKMNKTGRDKPHRGRNILVDEAMCIRKRKDPGPASYTVIPPKEFKEYKYGFNSSYDRPPGYIRQIVWPGVGRYKITNKKYKIKGQGHRSAFLCRCPRTIGSIIPSPMNSF